MKDIIEFQNNKCWSCDRIGFFITTPSGADYTTCPICKGDIDYMLYDKDNKGDPYHKNKVLDELLDKENNNLSMKFPDQYCNNCGILYGFSHTHAENGCTDDIYHSLLITKYEIIEENQKKYIIKCQYLNLMKKYYIYYKIKNLKF